MGRFAQIDVTTFLSCVGQCDLFNGIPQERLAAYAADAALIDFPRGSVIIRQGEAADSAYVIVDGTAEVVLEKPDGSEDLIEVLSAGHCVGDLGVILDQPRTSTVRAIRHCRTVRIDRAGLLRLHAREPEFSLRLARMVAQRLQRTTRQRVRERAVTDIAIIVPNPSPRIARALTGFADAVGALAGPPIAIHTTSSTDRNLADRLADADVALVMADAERSADADAIAPVLDVAQGIRPHPQVGLLLCHEDDIPAGGTRTWLADPRLHNWHHARASRPGDLGRVARLLSGRATGLALSGGGARGFAHIGVLQALEEQGIAVDYIAGTSMGAILAAQYAAGFGIDRMIAETRRAYVRRSGWPDFAFPSVAIYSGRATNRKLRAMFRGRMIEDLPTPYFAVAADLRRAKSVVLERGLVWQAARISCSVPGMLPPIERDGCLLVDGGLLDNLPVEAVRARCGGRVIASDVSVSVEFDERLQRSASRLRAKAARPGIAQIMMRTAQLASIRDSREAGTPSDLYLNPELNDVGMSDFRRLDELVERGAAHAREMLKNEEAWP